MPADVKLFDMRTSRMRWEGNTGNGVVALEFDRCVHFLLPLQFSSEVLSSLNSSLCVSVWWAYALRRDIEMNKLVATTLESRFTVYDMRTQHPESGFAHLTEKVKRRGQVTADVSLRQT